MEKIPRYDSRDALSWTRTENSATALRRWHLDLFTVRGWCTAGAGGLLVFVAYLLGRHEMMALGLALVALALANWGLALRLRGRTIIHRELLSAVPSVGEVSKFRLSCAERSIIQEQLPEDFGPGPRFQAPGSIEYELVFRTRGIHLVGPAQQIVVDPLGLIQGMVRTGASLQIPVRSQLHRLDRFAPLGERTLTGDAKFSRSTTTDYYDVATRDYQQGDSVRQVHWKASARHGKLMVRQENHVATAQALLVLDTSFEHWNHSGSDLRISLPQAHAEALTSSRRFENALSLASSIGLRYATSGYQLAFRDLTGASLAQRDPQSVSELGALNSFEDFHAATSDLALANGTVEANGSEILGNTLRKELLVFREEPVIMILGELTAPQAAWLATLSRTVRNVEVFLLVSHPERYGQIQLELARTSWKVHILPGNMAIDEMWG
ncbi:MULTISPECIES: DUF58 domain-containing protein [Micrococcaceae]|uniref:DUF58 domain-containing protein n=1 Tax=Micrococcaceae TaxID=1268 RepID=UPI000CFBF5F4|nr:DUF58 domain-containing protein [Arthrobacter sp. MYb214]PRB76735.1 hypothetical protein CQ012_06920 [Arthrobacter sp. MYb214]